MAKWLVSWWKGQEPEPPSSWFLVRWDDTSVHFDVRPPDRDAWHISIQWKAITRVCFRAESYSCSDGIYVFTKGRAESYAVPMDAGGGHEFWDELVRRGLFDAELAAKAMTLVDGVLCWPEPGAEDGGEGAAQQ
jgi:hypothetical protein